MKYDNIFNKPVVEISGNTVRKYYANAYATIEDGFNPYRVVLTCAHGQRTHKGKVFRFASEQDIRVYNSRRKTEE